MAKNDFPFILLIKKSNEHHTLLMDREKYLERQKEYDAIYAEADLSTYQRAATNYPQRFRKMGYDVNISNFQKSVKNDDGNGKKSNEKSKAGEHGDSQQTGSGSDEGSK